jgi:hypothetical protein
MAKDKAHEELTENIKQMEEKLTKMRKQLEEGKDFDLEEVANLNKALKTAVGIGAAW